MKGHFSAYRARHAEKYDMHTPEWERALEREKAWCPGSGQAPSPVPKNPIDPWSWDKKRER